MEWIVLSVRDTVSMASSEIWYKFAWEIWHLLRKEIIVQFDLHIELFREEIRNLADYLSPQTSE